VSALPAAGQFKAVSSGINCMEDKVFCGPDLAFTDTNPKGAITVESQDGGWWRPDRRWETIRDTEGKVTQTAYNVIWVGAVTGGALASEATPQCITFKTKRQSNKYKFAARVRVDKLTEGDVWTPVAEGTVRGAIPNVNPDDQSNKKVELTPILVATPLPKVESGATAGPAYGLAPLQDPPEETYKHMGLNAVSDFYGAFKTTNGEASTDPTKGLIFSGNEAMTRSTQTFTGLIDVTFSLTKDDTCNDHFVALSHNPDMKWSWSGMDQTLVGVWNCNNLNLMGNADSDATSCADFKDYNNVKLHVGEKEATLLAPTCRKLHLTKSTDYNFDFSKPYYLYIGADMDEFGGESTFKSFKVFQKNAPTTTATPTATSPSPASTATGTASSPTPASTTTATGL
jgi:hypothetical protein